jgi:hypothetical protein
VHDSTDASIYVLDCLIDCLTDVSSGRIVVM